MRSGLYFLARLLGDINSVFRAGHSGSPMPIIKRLWNKLIGRKGVSKVWWR